MAEITAHWKGEPISFPTEITFADIRVGDRIEVTHIPSDTVHIGTVMSKVDRWVYVGNGRGEPKYSIANADNAARNKETYRLLVRPKPKRKVGDFIEGTDVITLPLGSIVQRAEWDDTWGSRWIVCRHTDGGRFVQNVAYSNRRHNSLVSPYVILYLADDE
jgi:hypothetical protein